MSSCSLCINKYSKLFNPKERVLGTQLSSVINFIIGDHVEFPPKFLICPECSADLIKTEFVLERLLKSLPGNKSFKKRLLNSAFSHNEQDESTDEREDQRKKNENEEVDSSKKQNASNSGDVWTFHCAHCELTTNKANLYKKHLLIEHQVDNPRIYQCMYCQETYQRINGIQNHIACVHHNKPRQKSQRRKTIAFDTSAVLSSTTIKSQLDKEISMANTTIENNAADDPNAPYEFECTDCKYKTVNPKMYKKHLKIKHEIEDSRIYKCKRCPSTYVRQFALQNHIAYEHENKPKPKLQRRKSVAAADLETYTTGDKEDLAVIKVAQKEPEETEGHGEQEVNNENDTVYQNGNISIKSITDGQQNQHEHAFQTTLKRKLNHLSSSPISSAEWVFQCSFCDFESIKRKTYKAHMASQHGEIDGDIYKCIYCSAAYERYSLLQSHVTNKHCQYDLNTVSDSQPIYSGSGQDQDTAAKKRRVQETPKKSKHLKHIESSQEEPKNIQRLNGEKSQQKETCVVCGKPYSSVDKLRDHMDKQHGGDQIKSCPNCDAKFRAVEKYEAHLFSEKCLNTKLECQYPSCPKRFQKRSKMQQHMKEKHPELMS
ncbi:zinc finger protein 423-like [Rhagoletis pomonella]|uniref:zinc finger protein 423-like n=1 Tax=Rhagoletis pomonella TaxID=28610 RepID=UPI00177AFCF1|nr:zinc finger protein 423-like [Rhagoletis pomonella]